MAELMKFSRKLPPLSQNQIASFWSVLFPTSVWICQRGGYSLPASSDRLGRSLQWLYRIEGPCLYSVWPDMAECLYIIISLVKTATESQNVTNLKVCFMNRWRSTSIFLLSGVHEFELLSNQLCSMCCSVQGGLPVLIYLFCDCFYNYWSIWCPIYFYAHKFSYYKAWLNTNVHFKLFLS